MTAKSRFTGKQYKDDKNINIQIMLIIFTLDFGFNFFLIGKITVSYTHLTLPTICSV